MKNVSIYLKYTCPYCIAAKRLLDEKGVSYQEYNVNKLTSEELQELAIKTNNHRTVPKIFIEDYFVGGFDNLNQLNNEGKLDAMLA